MDVPQNVGKNSLDVIQMSALVAVLCFCPIIVDATVNSEGQEGCCGTLVSCCVHLYEVCLGPMYVVTVIFMQINVFD